MGRVRLRRRRAVLATLAAILLLVAGARAKEPEREDGAPPASEDTSDEQPSPFDRLPALRPPPVLGSLLGKPVARIEVVTEGGRWQESVRLRRVRLGDPLTPALARRAMQELTDSGRFASVRVEAEPEGSGALLRLIVLPRRIVGAIKVVGGALDEEETLRDAGIDPGAELTARSLGTHRTRIHRFYAERGYPNARVRAQVIDTDDPMRVLVLFNIEPGAPRLVRRRRFEVSGPATPKLRAILDDYAIEKGDRLDDKGLAEADEALEEQLRSRGWHRARVGHRLRDTKGVLDLVVVVDPGPLIEVRFEGVRHFDRDELRDALELEESDDRSVAALIPKLRAFYVERGFLDVEVEAEERGEPTYPVHHLVLKVYEGKRVRVVAREYPCLTGERDADDVGAEIDSFLSEALPGTGAIGAVDSAQVNAALGPKHKTGARVRPLELNPWNTFVPDVYERATSHLQELYRSEGYLSAIVGPVVVMRRRCAPGSPPGQCEPVGKRQRPATVCPKGKRDLPIEDPPAPATAACVPDRTQGIRCEAEVALHIPIKLGPRAVLWDLDFDGNETLVEERLFDVVELELGAPVSQLELEKARIRVLDAYAEEGFAFASVEVDLEVSPDRTRARARFIISEREQVRVKDIIVRGARITNESLILGRVALEEGELYRRSDVRKTEERLATLGVFSSITVGLEDPEVPAREKVVVITVQERAPQYLDVRPGFSTGEGIRVTFEYGHRNMGGEAIQLVLRVQLGFLPDPLILDEDVRRKFNELDLAQRLERRNSASVEFPEIGLGPLFRLGVDAIDVRDNARDFGLTKDALIVTLSYRPTTRFTTQLGGSLELNDARIFGRAERGALEQYLQDNPGARNLLRVPEGKTLAFAQRTGVNWDRRDNPFGATRGTFISGGVEHVRAVPADDETEITSDFLRLTNRLAGYLRLSEAGLALALSFQWGLNVQLIDGSRTYPDRLFFVGGVDSIRGFLQSSVVPQDIAERIEADRDLPDDDPNKLTVREVVVRGGDFMMNPRAELRIPLGGIWQTALFVDTGNLWVEPESVEPYRLRYASGTGLRATTPVGPLALDVGMNLDRRPWEDRFAFHFSIGLF